MLLKKRSYEPELIDIGPACYTDAEYTHCLYQMGRIGRLLSSDRLTVKAFKKLACPIDSILDVGCGGGSFTYRLAREFPIAQVTGSDIANRAISYAQETHNELPNLQFKATEKPELEESHKSYDVVTSTMVCHHLTDEQIVDFLQRASRVARKAIVINDLHRHWLAYAGFSIIAPLFFSNRLINHDGLLSIRRAFVKDDWVVLLQRAGFSPDQYTVRWGFLFRWIVTIRV